VELSWLSLLEPVGDPAPREVVGRQLDLHPVAGQDPDEVHPHLAADVGQHPVAALQLHAKHRVRQGLPPPSLHFDPLFFCHQRFQAPPRAALPYLPVSTSGPDSVIAMVCSKWAAKLPSFVTAVQPSSRIRTSQLPIVTIGSSASTMPGRSCGPRPGSPKFGTCGSSCRARPMPWPTKARTTEKRCFSTCCWMACETSERRRPGRHSLIPSSRLSRVTSSSCWT